MADEQNEAETILKSMATPQFTSDLLSLLRSREDLVYLTCNEEKRMKSYFKHLSSAYGYNIYIWDCYLGLLNLRTEKKDKAITDDITQAPIVLDKIIEMANADEDNAKAMKSEGIKGNIYILLDFHRFLEQNDPGIERRLKTFANISSMTTIVMTGPSITFSSSLEESISVLDFPLPNTEEIGNVLDVIVSAIEKQNKIPNLAKSIKTRRNDIVKSASGLTLNEASMAFSKTLVVNKDFHIPTILKEKEQIIKKKGILEFIEPKFTMKDVGGLKNMVHWLEKRKSAFSIEAEQYGIPSPKGCIMVGVPGGGKSLIAKAVSTLYQIPLLKLDFGRLFGSLVGDSERNIRSATQLAESVAPCCLYLDEIDKGIAGGQSSGQTDGGTTSRVISTLLTWMQEKEKSVFIIATANRHSTLPTELLRPGRFDEIFFVDLPSRPERKEIYQVILRRYGRNPDNFDLDLLVSKTENYSGAEIEKSIISGLFESFSDNRRELNTKDIVNAIGTFRPLYDIRKDDFDEMRDWAKERCVMANSNEIEDASKAPINLDI